MNETQVFPSRFAANLDTLMTLRGLKNSWVGDQIGVSRQAVHNWRHGESMSEYHQKRLRRAVGCTEANFNLPLHAFNLICLMQARNLASNALATVVGVPGRMVRLWMDGQQKPAGAVLERLAEALEVTRTDIMQKPQILSLFMWAQREEIPISRARELFALGLCTGIIENDGGPFVPAFVKAPENSKTLVDVTKRCSLYGEAGRRHFSHNLSNFMRRRRMKDAAMAGALGVNPVTVHHWKKGERTPKEINLSSIAAILECEVDDLMCPPKAA
jgi:transcriptional regulator with XRE-family HTH domain